MSCALPTLHTIWLASPLRTRSRIYGKNLGWPCILFDNCLAYSPGAGSLSTKNPCLLDGLGGTMHPRFRKAETGETKPCRHLGQRRDAVLRIAADETELQLERSRSRNYYVSW